jgi:hypothetical protein
MEIVEYCVVAGTSITIDPNRTLGATGTRPLVLLSTSTIVVDGTLDAASHIATLQDRGPGANPSACVAGTAPTMRGGGYGGSLGTHGGNGGNPVGGTPGNQPPPTALHGGCPGVPGAGTGGGNGGHGGGAVALIASTMISVSGTINASGKSGSSTTEDNVGGGGGGSGGMIVFDTPMLVFATNTRVFANGGGGGEGTGGNDGNDGTDPTGPAAGGAGGAGGTSGGDGGNGGFSTQPGTMGITPGGGEGGGGGGGGAGVIRVFRTTPPNLGLVSPPFS